MRMSTSVAAIAAASLGGCAHMDSVTAAGETTWQSLHVLDAVQTYRGPASDPCYYESDPLTRRLIGRHPSQAGVVGWGVGLSTLHYGVTALLADHGAPRWLQWTWQTVTSSSTAATVSHNVSIGLHMNGTVSHWGVCPQDLNRAPSD